MGKKTTIAVSSETKKLLEEVRSALEKVSGRKFSFDETVFFLLDWFVSSGSSVEESNSILNILKAKKELTDRIDKSNGLSLQEIKRNFFYVPELIVKRMEKIALKHKKFLNDVFLSSVKSGVFLQDKFFLAVREVQLNNSFAEVFSILSKDEQLKEIKNIDRKFHAFARGVLIDLKNKYKRTSLNCELLLAFITV